MSFIELDICGGRFAKGCGIMGVVLHALSGDASCLPFSDNTAAERWFHHETACHTISRENVQFRSAPRATALSSLFRIDLIRDFIT
jgi:hypothetical protein